jgi:hypothetical protein
MDALKVPILSLVSCLLFSLATSCPVFAQSAPGDQANGSI